MSVSLESTVHQLIAKVFAVPETTIYDVTQIISTLYDHSSDKKDITSLITGAKELYEYSQTEQFEIPTLIGLIAVVKEEYPLQLARDYQENCKELLKQPPSLKRWLALRTAKSNYEMMQINNWDTNSLVQGLKYLY